MSSSKHHQILATRVGGGEPREVLSVSAPEWESWASCGQPDTGGIWFLSDRPGGGALSPDVRIALERGAEICNTLCPVRAECLESAVWEDRLWTTRGGVLPASYNGRSVGRPKGGNLAIVQTSPDADPDYCRRGHDRNVTGKRANGHCAQCYRDTQAAARAENGVAPRNVATPVVTAEQLAAGACAQGHPVSASDGSLKPSGQCVECWAEYRRVDDRERKYRSGKRKPAPEAGFCKRGHAKTPENTILRQSRGYTAKECRECRKLRRTGAVQAFDEAS